MPKPRPLYHESGDRCSTENCSRYHFLSSVVTDLETPGDAWKTSGVLKPNTYDPPPKHYEGDGIMPWDVIDAWGLDYYLGNCTKYICRAGKKDSETRLADLVKVRNFILKAIELEEKRD